MNIETVSYNPIALSKAVMAKGRYGTVHKVFSREKKKYVAIKEIVCNDYELRIDSAIRHIIEREHRSWNIITEKNCKYNIPLHFACIYDNNVYFETDLIEPGSLDVQCIDHSCFTEKIRVLKNIALGIKEIHDLNMCHGDLKLPNILRDTMHNVKLCDYSNTDYCIDNNFGLHQCRGTPVYMAPDIFNRCYGKNVDVWALGVIAYYFFTYGKFPFDFMHKTLADMRLVILNTPVTYPEFLKPIEVDFISHCMDRDPHNRLSIDEVLDHPLFKLI